MQTSFEVLWTKRADVLQKSQSIPVPVAYNQSVSAFGLQAECFTPSVADAHLVTGSQHGLRRAMDTARWKRSIRSRERGVLKDYEGYSYAEIGQLTD